MKEIIILIIMPDLNFFEHYQKRIFTLFRITRILTRHRFPLLNKEWQDGDPSAKYRIAKKSCEQHCRQDGFKSLPDQQNSHYSHDQYQQFPNDAWRQCTLQNIKINKRLSIPFKCENRHFFTIGKPGAGKTQLLCRAIEKVVERNDKAIVYDFKGDYISRFYNIRFHGTKILDKVC